LQNEFDWPIEMSFLKAHRSSSVLPGSRAISGADGDADGGAAYTRQSEALMSDRPTREDAWALLTEFTDNPSLIKHGLGVEAAMRAYARSCGEDEEAWGVIGLVHDFDYQQNPTEETHLHVGTAILRDRGWPEEWVRIIASHADYMGVPRDNRAAKTLFAVDELSGFLTACALVRPDKSIAEVKVKSVKKKLKDKAFARGVNRDDVRNGVEELGVELGEHIEFVRDAMATIADQLELPPPE
jgi:putative nucleotidyltransferase with HDIG domain